LFPHLYRTRSLEPAINKCLNGLIHGEIWRVNTWRRFDAGCFFILAFLAVALSIGTSNARTMEKSHNLARFSLNAPELLFSFHSVNSIILAECKVSRRGVFPPLVLFHDKLNTMTIARRASTHTRTHGGSTMCEK
jgi:hypothetical protein